MTLSAPSYRFFEIEGWPVVVTVRPSANGGPGDVVAMTIAAEDFTARSIRIESNDRFSAEQIIELFDEDYAATALIVLKAQELAK